MPFITTMNGTMYQPSQEKKSASECSIGMNWPPGCARFRQAAPPPEWLLFRYYAAAGGSRQEGGGPISCGIVNRQRGGDIRRRVDLAGAAHRLERRLDDARQRAESDFAVEERGDGDLVGGVERRRRSRALGQRLAGDPQGGRT